MPDDHSKLVPLLPIPNRTVKRLRADDSADSRVKVGHRQAFIPKPPQSLTAGVLLLLFAMLEAWVKGWASPSFPDALPSPLNVAAPRIEPG